MYFIKETNRNMDNKLREKESFLTREIVKFIDSVFLDLTLLSIANQKKLYILK